MHNFKGDTRAKVVKSSLNNVDDSVYVLVL